MARRMTSFAIMAGKSSSPLMRSLVPRSPPDRHRSKASFPLPAQKLLNLSKKLGASLQSLKQGRIQSLLQQGDQAGDGPNFDPD